MARDDDAVVKAVSWEMLALLIQPDAQPTLRMLLKACPDVATTALKVDLVLIAPPQPQNIYQNG